MRLIGFTGWSGAGKTHLLACIIPILVTRGVSVATVKHAHHAFDIDHPGKDSYVHRAAGASEVLVASSRRLAHIVELGEAPEPPFRDLLARIGARDIILAEGFKREAHRKIEVFRAANGKPPLFPEDETIVAVASDAAFTNARVPVLALDDANAIATFVLAGSEPLAEYFQRTDGAAQ